MCRVSRHCLAQAMTTMLQGHVCTLLKVTEVIDMHCWVHHINGSKIGYALEKGQLKRSRIARHIEAPGCPASLLLLAKCASILKNHP